MVNVKFLLVTLAKLKCNGKGKANLHGKGEQDFKDINNLLDMSEGSKFNTSVRVTSIELKVWGGSWLEMSLSSPGVKRK